MLLKEGWSVKQTEAAVEVINAITIPELFHNWLNPEKWKRQAITDFLKDSKSDTHKRVTRWANTAQAELDSLPDDRPIWVFVGGKPRQESFNLKQQFLADLPSIANPSDEKIRKVVSKLLSHVDTLDKEYERWKSRQQADDERRKAEEEEKRQRLKLELEYAPRGFCGDIREIELEPESFDACITDPPYLLSNGGTSVRSGKKASVNKNFDDSAETAITPDEWIPIVTKALKPGGYLVFTCTIHILQESISAALKSGLEFHQKLIWYKRNSIPLLVADRFKPDHEDILVFVKPGDAHYFGYDDVKLDDKQRGSVIDIPQCGGKERLGWHDTQKPLELANLLTLAYVPPGGIVLEPFAGTGTFAAACKKLGRKVQWVEQKEEFFQKCESRLEQTRYFWENSIDP